MKKGFLKTAFSAMLLGSVVALTSCHESASVNIPVGPVGPVAPVAVAAPTTVIVSPVTLAGTAIPGAVVTLTIPGVATPFTATADANGVCTFNFPTIVANTAFKAKVSAAGYDDAEADGVVDKGEVAYLAVYMAKDAATAVADGNAADVTPAEAAVDVDEILVTESTLPVEDADANNTKINVGIHVPAQTLEDKVLFVPFYDPDLAVAEMTRAGNDYLYCGIRAYLENGQDIKSGKTLQSPITISFSVEEALKPSLVVKKLNTSGNWVDVNTIDNSYTNVVKITDSDLTYYGLFFVVAKSEAAASSRAFTIANYEVGPFVSKAFNYSFDSGAKLASTSGSSFGVAFLKTLVTRDFGRVGRDFTTRRATYDYSYPVYANQYLKVTAEQAYKTVTYTGASAVVSATAAGNVTISPVVYTIQSVHSGGLVDGE